MLVLKRASSLGIYSQPLVVEGAMLAKDETRWGQQDRGWRLCWLLPQEDRYSPEVGALVWEFWGLLQR